MSFKLKILLKYYLMFGGLYLFTDALVHLFDIKLIDVKNSWPNSSLVYGQFIAHLFASFAILASILAIVASKNLDKYRTPVVVSGFWALFHG